MAALLAAAPRPLFADLWYEHYNAAIEALEEERWTEAIEQLTASLEKRGDSAARARTYGMKFITYFPYLMLGIAYYHLDQLDAALQAFETEERLGAVRGSDESLRKLEEYRQAALRKLQDNRAEETRRVDEIIAEGLSEATRLERAGELDDAVAAVSRSLAVAPEHGEALATLSRLREKLKQRQEEEDLARRVGGLVQQGRELLTRGDLARGASILRQALTLAENEEARHLLDLAQSRLRAQAGSEPVETTSAITTALTEAEELERTGSLDAALERLQSVRALDPDNSAARELEARLLAARTERQQEETAQLRRDSIADLLRGAEEALSAARFEQALAAANRVLALEAGNPTALDQLARAYRGLNSRLLGGTPRQNFPPAIRFVDQRHEHEGLLAELVRQPVFRLTGVVIDSTAVELAFFDEFDRRIDGSHASQPLGDLHITEFQIERPLPVGLSSLRLVATDAEGLSSSATYDVFYLRPVWRSPAVWIGGGGGLSLALALLLAARVRRRRQLRQRRFNPYMAGAPVLDTNLFFGREQLIERILQTLHNNSLLLHGERRIGKTTLQHQLKRRLQALDDPAYEFYPVYIDLQGTPEERFFATLAEEVFHELADEIDDLEPCTPLDGAYGYRDLLRDLRSILKRLHGATDKRVRLVLLIDEVDELNSYDPRVNQKLRSLFMKSFAEDLVAVVSGVSIKREWDREGSPWYNFFEEIDVGPFRLDDARKLIEHPIRGVLRFEEGAVERIIELSDYRPYRIQRLCMKLVSRMYELDRRRITVNDVDEVGDPASQGAA